MAKDFAFDPVTRDLVRDGKGGWTFTDNASTTVMHQMLCHADQCWHDDQLGSNLHDLKALQGAPEVSAPAEAERALNVLVGRGRIANLEAKAEVPVPGRVVVATSFRDTSTGQIVQTRLPTGR